MSRFAKLDSALKLALSEIKDEIKVTPVQTVAFKPERHHNHSKKVHHNPNQQKINGYVVKWETTGDRKIPVIQNDKMYIQYPSKLDDIKDVPVGCVRASYDAVTGCVEYFSAGAEEPMKRKFNQRFTGLPYPRFMGGLETVEEIDVTDPDTGEVTVELKLNVLDEYSHWLLRLKEFETQSKAHGVPKATIEKRMAGFVKNLKATRGVDMLDPTNRIPPHLLSAIEFVKQKQAVR